jgi:hypothetical protein
MKMDAARVPTGAAAGRADAVAEDEALAAAARARYLRNGIASIEPDRRTRSALGHQEQLLAVRRPATIHRLAAGSGLPISGQLVITTERLILIKRQSVTLAYLDELEDVTLVLGRLEVILTKSAGFAINAYQPRLLRVQLAAGRAQWLDHQAGASPKAPSADRGDLPRW